MCALPGLYFKMLYWCILCNGYITQLIATGLQYRLIEVFVLAKLLSVSYCTCNLSNFMSSPTSAVMFQYCLQTGH